MVLVHLHNGMLISCHDEKKRKEKFVGKCIMAESRKKKVILNEVTQTPKDKHVFPLKMVISV